MYTRSVEVVGVEGGVGVTVAGGFILESRVRGTVLAELSLERTVVVPVTGFSLVGFVVAADSGFWGVVSAADSGFWGVASAAGSCFRGVFSAADSGLRVVVSAAESGFWCVVSAARFGSSSAAGEFVPIEREIESRPGSSSSENRQMVFKF